MDQGLHSSSYSDCSTGKRCGVWGSGFCGDTLFRSKYASETLPAGDTKARSLYSESPNLGTEVPLLKGLLPQRLTTTLCLGAGLGHTNHTNPLSL